MPWELQNDRQIWLQLAEVLTRRIVSGEYPAGIRIPSVRDLAAEAGVNPNTMQRALAALEQDTLVAANRTAGRFVTEDAALVQKIRMELAREHIAAYLQGMATLGFTEQEARALLKEE